MGLDQDPSEEHRADTPELPIEPRSFGPVTKLAIPIAGLILVCFATYGFFVLVAAILQGSGFIDWWKSFSKAQFLGNFSPLGSLVLGICSLFILMLLFAACIWAGIFVVMIPIGALLGVAENAQAKKARRKACALADVVNALETLESLTHLPDAPTAARWRAETELNKTFERAHTKGLLLDSFPDEVIASMGKQDQLRTARDAYYRAASAESGTKERRFSRVSFALALIGLPLTLLGVWDAFHRLIS
ncbi:hypothetical protein AB0J47_39950 [Nocardia sp. NPDC049737]|uniref:hypothetical protein n=1 Tax=Nocardia sp. NPDC049737 TaxID=3154358 RepID=UPI003436BA4F